MNTTAPTTTPTSRRRWFQFSLRTMLVVTAGVSAPVATVAEIDSEMARIVARA